MSLFARSLRTSREPIGDFHVCKACIEKTAMRKPVTEWGGGEAVTSRGVLEGF
ncbi:predicted protein [Sclerotinia sclerotiorum 1980 UF-70]|uniref:Uncharacterized protein n=1 Tax=Sclerotinia sclerotiorum (strain ATCC 18683 / 1980 / Ss-1) TaxID=665079 RepID=A7EIV4_SCLS1|nr:predicted protein [Sclerotinia sclerotiorum 1980 UF-70]EDO02770.1 predicted protein [Sclerotinia sclerotiorum 1980 UF-70]